MQEIRSMRVVSVTGVALTVLDLPPGTWGAFPAAASDQRQVEFYDTRYGHTTFGQFTGGRYYADTLLESPRNADNYGLALNGDVRDWTISNITYRAIVAWLKQKED